MSKENLLHDIRLVLDGCPVDIFGVDRDLSLRILSAVDLCKDLYFGHQGKEFYIDGSKCSFYMVESYDEDGLRI